jgi:hypothetical protein
MFSGLAPLVVEAIERDGESIRVRARTPDAAVTCPGCGAETQRVHGYHDRVVADVPVDARLVVVRVRVRRLICDSAGCHRTFREQVPGILQRYQRRTVRLSAQIGAVVKELAGRASTRALAALTIFISRHTVLRVLLRLPLPARPVPRVLGVDDFALLKRHRYATVLIDALTGQRIDVLPDRLASTLEAWLRAHPGVEIVCRDSSGAYAEAIRRALPNAVQVGDRWHIWHNLAEAVLKEVAAHSGCWAKASLPAREGSRAVTTRERWQQVHDLLGKRVGLLECARRLNLGLNMTAAGHPQNPLTAYQTLDGDYATYLAEIGDIFGQVAALLRPGGHAVISVANLSTGPTITPLAWDVARTVAEHLVLQQEVFLCWDHQPAGISGDYCLVFQRTSEPTSIRHTH